MQHEKGTPDLIAQAITQTVQRSINNVIEAKLSPIVEQLQNQPQPAKPADYTHDVKPAPLDRVIAPNEMAATLGMHAKTLARHEREGKFPKRSEFPNGQTGWLESEYETFKAGRKPVDPHKSAERAGRFN